MIANIEGEILKLTIAKEQYSEAIIYKCFNWYLKEIEVDIVEEHLLWQITLRINEAVDLQQLIKDIKRDLIDYKLRQIVLQETAVIRELIIAKAFAYEEDMLSPETSVSDPVGFDITKIQ